MIRQSNVWILIGDAKQSFFIVSEVQLSTETPANGFVIVMVYTDHFLIMQRLQEWRAAALYELRNNFSNAKQW